MGITKNDLVVGETKTSEIEDAEIPDLRKLPGDFTSITYAEIPIFRRNAKCAVIADLGIRYLADGSFWIFRRCLSASQRLGRFPILTPITALMALLGKLGAYFYDAETEAMPNLKATAKDMLGNADLSQTKSVYNDPMML